MPRPNSSQMHPSASPSVDNRPTVLVIGGSGGIGRAICLEFGRAGWRVGVHYRDRRKEAAWTLAAIRAGGGEGLLCRADVRDSRQVDGMVQEVRTRWGRLDVLVCSAGQASSNLVLRLHPDEWATTIETNLTGTFHCLKAAGQVMLTQRNGSVIVVASFAGLQGQAGQAAYAASKAGLLGLVKTAAREWGPSNVRVNAILPGWHQTNLAEPAFSRAAALDNHVLRRLTSLSAVASSVFHLALLHDASGQVWNLDSRIL